MAYSSAPSMVTSRVGYWSTSPSRKPALTMSSFDWKPVHMGIVCGAMSANILRTSRDEDTSLVQIVPLGYDAFHDVRYGGSWFVEGST